MSVRVNQNQLGKKLDFTRNNTLARTAEMKAYMDVVLLCVR